MNFHSLLLTDTSDKKSATLTVFIFGALVVHAKFFFGGLKIAGLAFPLFSGSDYGVAMASLGAIYVLRRSTDTTTPAAKLTKED